MLYILGITITFFLFFILVGKKDKSGADKILAIWLFVMGTHLTFFYTYISGNYIKYPFFLGWELPMPLLHGPFLYLYCTTLTKQIKKINLYHFVPYVIALVLISSFLLLSNQDKIEVYKANGRGYEFFTATVLVGVFLSGTIYCILSLLSLRKHRKKIENEFSSIEKINLRWLTYLVFGLSAIWIIVFIRNDEMIFTALVFYIFYIGYFGIKQVGIFTNKMPELSFEITTPTLKKDEQRSTQFIEQKSNTNLPYTKLKYEKSSLNTENLQEIHLKLISLMKDEKCFKDPEITLPDLAKKLDVHPNSLSQVINSIEQKNFYDYINAMRVEEFKSICIIPKNQQFTLLALAFECGFNSKTSFNRNFKKVTNLSPSDFLKSTNISLQ